MTRQLLTLPLRVAIRGTRMFWQVAEGVAGRTVLGALQVVQTVTKDDSSSKMPPVSPPEPRPARPEPESPAPEPARARSEPPDAASAGGEEAPIISGPPLPDAGEAATVSEAESAHVSEEPVLVREEAEPGAEDGAGPSVTIDPPWDGYDGMGARQVIARLADAGSAELATVQLYESSNRSRRTVLEAVERQLKAANGPG